MINLIYEYTGFGARKSSIAKRNPGKVGAGTSALVALGLLEHICSLVIHKNTPALEIFCTQGLWQPVASDPFQRQQEGKGLHEISVNYGYKYKPRNYNLKQAYCCLHLHKH